MPSSLASPQPAPATPAATPSAAIAPAAPVPPAITSPWPVALAIFTLAALTHSARGTLTSNELDTLLTTYRLLHPDFLPGDWFLSIPQGPRLPFQLLIAPLSSVLPPPAVSIAGRLLCFLSLAWLLGRLGQRVGVRWPVAMVACGLYAQIGPSLAAKEWIFGQFESKVVAYALTLFALDAAIDRRWRRAALALGAATTLHVLVGGIASAAMLLVALRARQAELGWRGVLPTAVGGLYVLAWALPAAPGLSILLDALRTAPPPSEPSISWIYVLFRAPHHADPRQFLAEPRVYVRAVWVAAMLFASWHWQLGGMAGATLRRLTLAAMIPFALGTLAAWLPGGERVLQLLPFRLGDALTMLAAAVFAATLIERGLAALKRRGVTTARLGAAALTLAVLATVGGAAAAMQRNLQELSTWPEGGHPPLPPSEAAALSDAAAAIARMAAPGVGVLAAPNHESLGWLARQPVVATFKHMPPDQRAVRDWFERIVALAGGRVLPERGYPLIDASDRAFEALFAAQHRALGRRYGMGLLLVRRRDLPLPILHRNAVWTVYDLRPTPPPDAEAPRGAPPTGAL